jgi:hypothetical protein
MRIWEGRRWVQSIKELEEKVADGWIEAPKDAYGSFEIPRGAKVLNIGKFMLYKTN